MANTRRKPATGARRRAKKPTPGWVWATAGLIVGLFVALLVWMSSWKNQPGVEQPLTVKETAQPPAVTRSPVAQQAVAKPKPVQKPVVKKKPEPKKVEKPKAPSLDFYNMLPAQTVEAPTNNYRSKESSGAGPLLQPAPATSNVSGKRYILQAGSFRKSNDADKRRAQLALMGIESKIEKVRVNDGVWHRVRVGPFTSMDTANQTRAQLHSQNIQTMLVNAGK